ncbi:cell division protein ftsj [Culex quinquefasciatus]|uniref:Cell division protein ftsj n=1 Tax=Culex quinquefasciatus TaxID=7176 RepID=B0XGX8_CULQU|nr:cell division protein ftsj [Culex quinquefasciatus]|eukprot:XP_001868900.1 cell division protein ftsj [Culex quinquefasciatus]
MSSPNASLLMKVWDNGEVPALEKNIQRYYQQVKRIKPRASRADSAENFVLARGFVGVERGRLPARLLLLVHVQLLEQRLVDHVQHVHLGRVEQIVVLDAVDLRRHKVAQTAGPVRLHRNRLNLFDGGVGGRRCHLGWCSDVFDRVLGKAGECGGCLSLRSRGGDYVGADDFYWGGGGQVGGADDLVFALCDDRVGVGDFEDDFLLGAVVGHRGGHVVAFADHFSFAEQVLLGVYRLKKGLN